MKRHGIRKSGLLITSTVVRTSIETLLNVLSNKDWMIVGSIASQLWSYFLTDVTVFCRPTDNIDIVGINIMDAIEDYFGVISSGFSSDEVRELNFYVSYSPRFRVHVVSYNNPLLIDGFNRRTKINIWGKQIPVISMEDLIIKKLLVGRIEDDVDIINLLRAYRRYLLSLIVNGGNQEIFLSFNKIREIIREEYSDLENEIEDRFKELIKVDLSSLEKVEGDKRKVSKILAV